MDVKQATGFDIRYYAVEQYDTQIFNVFSFLSDKSTFGFVDYEDDYMYTYYETPTGEVYFVDQLANLSQETLSTLIPKNNYKPAYFETMFYRAYYGTNTTRAPGYLLKHFAVVYSSPYVIIMKYSEGARVSGSVGFASDVSANMSTYPNFMAIAFDQYGIPHDYMYVDFNGTYSLLLPEGNCSIGLMLGDHAVNVSRRIQVDMDEAQRLVDHTAAENITVGLSNVAINVSTNQTDLWFSMQGQYFGGIYTSPVFSNDFSSLVNVFPDNYDIQLLYTNNTVYYQTTQFIDTGNNTILLNK
jgi:hypothetical protein